MWRRIGLTQHSLRNLLGEREGKDFEKKAAVALRSGQIWLWRCRLSPTKTNIDNIHSRR
uniref:Uncharacterized protein n=1 Tax=Meloidogyne enterolobii TaxID=390850 RepID=A0A6V7VZH2_MELEN|nr:unnamed protein product [Meloidogyne enterolobii]